MKAKATTKYEQGSVAAGAIGFVLSFACAGVVTHFLLTYFSFSSSVVPWALISILMAPLAYATTVRLKFGELREQKGLSQSEKRRLNGMLDIKLWHLNAAIIGYISSAALIGLLFSFFNQNPDHMKNAISFASGLLVGCLYTVRILLKESGELERFKGKLSDRAERRKRQTSALKDLKSPPEKA